MWLCVRTEGQYLIKNFSIFIQTLKEILNIHTKIKQLPTTCVM